MSTRKKINWLLILQGWAMLWVVIGHSSLDAIGRNPHWESLLFKFAYSFHMPLFIFVSGYLFYKTRINIRVGLDGFRGYWAIMVDKFKRLLIPGLVFSLLALVLKLVFPEEISRKVSLSVNEILHMYLYPNDNPLRELWFVAVLMWLFILHPIWKLTLRKGWHSIVVLIGLIMLHYLHPSIEFLCIGRVFGYAIWFYLGILACKYNIVETLLNRSVVMTIIIGIIIYFIGTYTNDFITTTGGIILSIGVSLCLDKVWPKALSSFRSYTYQIFLMGIFAQLLVKIIYHHIIVSYIPAYFVCIVFGIYVPVVMSKLIERINWAPLLLCVGLKSKRKDGVL